MIGSVEGEFRQADRRTIACRFVASRTLIGGGSFIGCVCAAMDFGGREGGGVHEGKKHGDASEKRTPRGSWRRMPYGGKGQLLTRSRASLTARVISILDVLQRSYYTLRLHVGGRCNDLPPLDYHRLNDVSGIDANLG